MSSRPLPAPAICAVRPAAGGPRCLVAALALGILPAPLAQDPDPPRRPGRFAAAADPAVARPGEARRKFHFTRAVCASWGRPSWATDYPKAAALPLPVLELRLRDGRHFHRLRPKPLGAVRVAVTAAPAAGAGRSR
jgi:hypothetical protein